MPALRNGRPRTTEPEPFGIYKAFVELTFDELISITFPQLAQLDRQEIENAFQLLSILSA